MKKNLKRFLAVGFVVFKTIPAQASPQLGLDFLGIKSAKWECSSSLTHFPPGHSLGVLIDKTFGDSNLCIGKILASDKPSSIRIHLLNWTCIRNRVCTKEEAGYGYTIPSISAELERENSPIYTKLNNLLAEALYITKDFKKPVYISPLLEHDLPTSTAVKVFRWAQANTSWVPNVQIVNNPTRASYVSGVNETHMLNLLPNAPCLYSTDGNSVDDINMSPVFEKRKSCIVYIWHRYFNGRLPGPFVAPRQRKNFPTSDLFAHFAHITPASSIIPKAGRPAPCSRVVPFKSPWIWKPLAEQKNNNDRRADKPVYIGPLSRSKTINLINASGRTVSKLQYYGTYQNGLHRYYSTGDSAFQMYRKSSSVYLQTAEQCIGPINPLLRNGLYR